MTLPNNLIHVNPYYELDIKIYIYALIKEILKNPRRIALLPDFLNHLINGYNYDITSEDKQMFPSILREFVEYYPHVHIGDIISHAYITSSMPKTRINEIIIPVLEILIRGYLYIPLNIEKLLTDIKDTNNFRLYKSVIKLLRKASLNRYGKSEREDFDLKDDLNFQLKIRAKRKREHKQRIQSLQSVGFPMHQPMRKNLMKSESSQKLPFLV